MENDSILTRKFMGNIFRSNFLFLSLYFVFITKQIFLQKNKNPRQIFNKLFGEIISSYRILRNH